ncbi:MAG TPA: tetratricopeptide repeat protein [Terracidiphilus sp.]|nr:tetratricopeptide repeat protein [Terracidiphilus sp.]
MLFLSTWRSSLRPLGLALALTFAVRIQAQAGPDSATEAANAGGGRILLVLPFDNRSGQPNLEWIREAAPELLDSRLASAGFAPMNRADRIYALDHLGLPEGFQPSRASSLKLAQTLDADSIIVGSYLTDGSSIVAEARVVDVAHLHMSAPVTARGEMRDMIAVFDSLAWKLTREVDPKFSVAEETFVAAGKDIRLDAFEQYIRGIAEPDHDERVRHLKKAAELNPNFDAAWFALGREDYSTQQYDDAAAAFAKVGRDDPDVLEAGFYRGMSLLFSGNYPEAEKAFAAVANVLPLAEVLNNEGVAKSRQSHDASALFIAAETADPNAADYHFNLAVTLKRRGATAEALAELIQCLKLRPNDSEAQDLEKEWKSPSAAPSSGGADPAAGQEAKADPLERIERTFDARAFRQAAVMMDQMAAARLDALTPHDRALKLAAQAKEFLDRGLLLEAERLYQAAASADGSVADAHAGLAEVRERSGDSVDARKEAQTALELKPSAEAYLVLGRLDLAAGHFDDARKDAGQAQQLDPGSKESQDLTRQIALKAGKSQ